MSTATPPSRLPDDQAQRERIRSDLDTSLFVEAGAGSGKTTALVQRIVSLVRSGTAEITEIAAITFTRTAASELRAKVRDELEEAARLDSLGEAQSARVRRALADLDGAAIQTIDSFALSLLRERPIEAGLPPVIEVRDEIEATISFEERWRGWVTAALDDPEFTSALSMAGRLGLRSPMEELRRVALRFHGNHDLVRGLSFPHLPSRPLRSPSRLIDGKEQLLALTEQCNDPEDRMLMHVQQVVLPLIERLAVEPEEAELLATLAEAPSVAASGKGNRRNWTSSQGGAPALDELRDLLAKWRKEIDFDLDSRRRGSLASLLAAVAGMVTEYAEDRRREGIAEFHDSLVWARRLLQSDQAALSHFSRRFPKLLIDEFQDTDPLQIEVARLLAETSPGSGPEPGSLFLVGDSKQSIYRFRRADLRTLAPVRAQLASGHIQLTATFRMHERLAAWINHVFSSWMVGGGDDQPHYAPLVAAAPAPSGASANALEPRPGAHLLGAEMASGSIRQVREAEADAIARTALSIGTGGWKVRDAGGETRPSIFSDLCILMRARTSLPLLERALQEHSVPYALEGQTTIFASQDVRDLLSALTAIDDPTDQIAVAASLRSPAFGCSDAELWDWRTSADTFDYSEALTGPAGPVRDGLNVLASFRRLRDSLSVAALIERFVRARRLREVASLGGGGRDRIRRLDLIIEMAGTLGESGRTSLGEFVAWARGLSERGQRLLDAPLAASGDDSVRVMTVHAAKGLEFPIVILTGVGSPVSRPVAQEVLFDLAARPGAPVAAVRLGAKTLRFETDGYAAAVEQESKADEAEQVRLMYVACTRARDHLIVSVFRKSGDAKSHAARFASLTAGRPDLADMLELPASLPVPPTQTAAAPWGDLAHRVWWHEARQRALEASATPDWVSATSLHSVTLSGGHDLPIEKERSQRADAEPWRSGRGAAPLGLAVHAVLQELGPCGADDIASIAARDAAAHGIPDRAAEVARLAGATLRTGVVREAASSPWWGVEVSVSAPAGEGRDIVIEGIIDLIYEAPDGLVIVDYKTDAASGRDLGAAAAPYVLQLGAYAWAVEHATGRSVARAVIVFARRADEGFDAEYRIPDLAGTMRLALERGLSMVQAPSVSGGA